MDALVTWMEPRHGMLLRTLIDSVDEKMRLPGSPESLTRIGTVFENLRHDTSLRFAEFREKWITRLEAKALLPFLQRNQWIVPHPQGGVTLLGKGTRKEARLFYLQTLHDMASDAARQWASMAGRLQALQEDFAKEWLRELPSEGAFRIQAVLEAALRDAELQAWKSLRLSLGTFAEEAFVNATVRWEQRRFISPEALVREIASPWRKRDVNGNGFIGFMQVLSGLAERLTLTMLDHYDRKWELLLRGFADTSSNGLEKVSSDFSGLSVE